MKVRTALLASALLAARLADAHDFWIEPSTFRPFPGESVTASLRVGQRLEGDAFPRVPDLVEKFVLKGISAESPVAGEPGDEPAGSARVPSPGLFWIGYQSHPFPLTLDARKYEDALVEEGLERIVEARAKAGRSAAVGRERFYRCAKALLLAPDPKGAKAAQPAGRGVVAAPLGFTLELVPQADPYAAAPGSPLTFAVLFRGKPLTGVLVRAIAKGEPGAAVSARSDAKGLVTLRFAKPGFWLVKAVHMEPAPKDAGVDWESWWASVTFEMSPGRGR